MPKALESFVITPFEDGYLLQIEDDDGTTLELNVSFDQLELIAERIDDQLELGEPEAIEIDEDEPGELEAP